MNLKQVACVDFPLPAGIHINMMPFIIGAKASLPVELHSYWPLVLACDVERGEHGRVGYLSIHESPTDGAPQRRPGIHTEGHPSLGWGGGGKGGWGGGAEGRQGLYMASTMEGSCRAWNAYVFAPGPMGDCEHLRGRLQAAVTLGELDEPVTLEPNTIYWMTDRTPHEALPTKKGYRQWFRFVTSPVEMWYRKHSTVNPLGVMPACPVIEEDKFAWPK